MDKTEEAKHLELVREIVILEKKNIILRDQVKICETIANNNKEKEKIYEGIIKVDRYTKRYIFVGMLIQSIIFTIYYFNN